MQKPDIERIFYRSPFAPFRIVLDDGEEIDVMKKRKALVSGPEAAVVGVSRRNGGPGIERLRIVPLKKVISLQPLPS